LYLNEASDDGVLGWQWRQLDHMQTICTSLLRDNHTNTSSLAFHRPDETDNHTNTSSLAFHRPDETDNHTNTSSLAFHRPDALPGAQPTVSAH